MRTALWIAFWSSLAHAGGVAVPIGKAPPLERREVGAPIALGVFDDVLPCPEADGLLVRRGAILALVSMVAPYKRTDLVRNPRLSASRLLATVKTKDRFWVLLNGFSRGGRIPVLYDVGERRVVELRLAGVKLSAEGRMEARLCAFDADRRGLLVSLAGAREDGWPRDGHRPVFLWVDLATGKLRPLPVGFDLDHFSADRRVAVFDGIAGRGHARRSVAWDLATGGFVEEVPDRRAAAWSPYDWQDTGEVSGLSTPRVRGDSSSLAGFVWRGRPVPLRFPKPLSLRFHGDLAGGWAALVAGGPRGLADRQLWFAPARRGAAARHLGDGVGAYAALGDGRCVFAVATHLRSGPTFEGFGYDETEGRAWRLLDGVVRLPPAPAKVAASKNFRDRTLVAFTRGFGASDTGRLVLARFARFQNNLVAWTPVAGAPDPPVLWNEQWHRRMLLSADGRRHLVELFDRGPEPDLLWLHNQGTLVTARIEATRSTPPQRKLVLERVTLR